jgi:hypothetical protein
VADAVLGEPRLGLNRGRIGHAAAPGSALAIAGDRSVDQARVALGQRLVVEPEEAQRAGAEILDDDVGRVAQAQREVERAGLVQVDADVALAGVLLGIVAGHALLRGEGEARDVGRGRLDLDHLGAEVQQGARAQPPGEHAGKIDDAHAAQWPAQVSAPGIGPSPGRSA